MRVPRPTERLGIEILILGGFGRSGGKSRSGYRKRASVRARAGTLASVFLAPELQKIFGVISDLKKSQKAV